MGDHLVCCKTSTDNRFLWTLASKENSAKRTKNVMYMGIKDSHCAPTARANELTFPPSHVIARLQYAPVESPWAGVSLAAPFARLTQSVRELQAVSEMCCHNIGHGNRLLLNANIFLLRPKTCCSVLFLHFGA